MKNILIILCFITTFNTAFANDGWLNILNEGGNNKGTKEFQPSGKKEDGNDWVLILTSNK